MGVLFHTLQFHIFSPPLPLPLFNLALPCRLMTVADALPVMIHIDLLLLLLLLSSSPPYSSMNEIIHTPVQQEETEAT
jgi:hypothetical protein